MVKCTSSYQHKQATRSLNHSHSLNRNTKRKLNLNLNHSHNLIINPWRSPNPQASRKLATSKPHHHQLVDPIRGASLLSIQTDYLMLKLLTTLHKTKQIKHWKPIMQANWKWGSSWRGIWCTANWVCLIARAMNAKMNSMGEIHLVLITKVLIRVKLRAPSRGQRMLKIIWKLRLWARWILS